MKKIFNHYLDKRSEIMKNTQFKVKDIFGDIINNDCISSEQITKLRIFFGQNNVNNNFCINLNLFKPKMEKNSKYEPSAPPAECSNF